MLVKGFLFCLLAQMIKDKRDFRVAGQGITNTQQLWLIITGYRVFFSLHHLSHKCSQVMPLVRLFSVLYVTHNKEDVYIYSVAA